MVNEERTESGRSALQIDEQLAAAADKHAQEMVSGKFCSHQSLDGSTPYMRYFASGCTDHISENVMGFDAERGMPYGEDDIVNVARLAKQLRDTDGHSVSLICGCAFFFLLSVFGHEVGNDLGAIWGCSDSVSMKVSENLARR